MRGGIAAWSVVGAFVVLSAVAVVGVAAHADGTSRPATADAVLDLPGAARPAAADTPSALPSEPFTGSDAAPTGAGVTGTGPAGSDPAGSDPASTDPATSSLTALVDPAWAAAVASRTAAPSRALLAYAGASLRLGAEQPGCRLGWTTLAAIGAVESDHGRHGGSALGADGTARPPIIGVALDGGAFAAISDSDDGAVDGDPAWDRAVGPFQFIPATWRQWGADGDGDGDADPQSIDDAALAAGRYLCAYGDLADPSSWRTAVFAYNHDESYVDSIAVAANALAVSAG
ncbi:lytic murein transglycosylase [Herbiconiux sp. VKM Ac-2851]|uniref:lytic murein transglycosylase n=1 Tax=Herbiconiux sp. VKM Ac-2851 TaxID=2739025 RepID=UPI0015631E0A|nr:lytic murein transglycosylase [Herbiconiux sp. VKM Ac-2851]NQX36538.1 lytic murein transglycosylase [Herbiconiux sp. VKM Ac-2851]